MALAYVSRVDPHQSAIEAIDAALAPLEFPSKLGELDSVIERVGDARFVLLGEATHGTHEFYRTRARITQRLISEKGFNIVAVEGDWPDCYRVNRFVRCVGNDSAHEALSGFGRFPQWMWRNSDVLAFVHWLRRHNEPLESAERVGFYGLDVYSLEASVAAVIGYLERLDPRAAREARARYACFDLAGRDGQAYGFRTAYGGGPSCEEAVIEQLLELRADAWRYLERDGLVAADEQMSAEQNARVVQSAEQYYREMYFGRSSSWNLRDTHMADTLDFLTAHIGKSRGEAKAVVWAHNSHVGDARATSMARRGELNLGQLVRERHGAEAVIAGFTTYDGTVAAANDWGCPVQIKRVLPARDGSIEALLHRAREDAFVLDLARVDAAAGLDRSLLERAIGVIYRPDTELASHYFQARVAEQLDLLIHFDHTRAVRPLERRPIAPDVEPPETYPSGV